MNLLFDSCKFEAVALREGGLRGVLGRRMHAHASYCGFVFDFPCHGRFPVPSGHYLRVHIHQASAESWCAGMPLRSGTTLVVLPGNACEIVLNAHSMVSVLMAPLQEGGAHAFERNAPPGGMGRRFLSLAPECLVGTPWRFRCESAFHALVHPQGEVMQVGDEDFFDSLLDPAMLDDLMVHARGYAMHADAYCAHYNPLRRAIDFMRKNLHRDIYLDELARAARMSDRGLRYAFADLLGVSPTRYLALLRLHEASRRLFMGSAGRLSVKSVAMSCGWWDLSRFAANYRRAFGEHPSDTLLRASSLAS